MKRLLRKTAEFIDAIEISGNYTEIYKNPTGREFDAIKEYSNTVRAFLHPNGDIFAWRSDILHDKMAKIKPEIASDYRAEADENGNLQLYLTSNIKTLEQIVELFNVVDFNKLNLKSSANVSLNLQYYKCTLEEASFLNGKTIDEIKNVNIDELLNSKLNESDYLNALKKLLKNGYEKVSEHAVTNSMGVYVYYDKSAKEIYAFGPLMEKIIINNPKDCYSEISNIVNNNLNTFKNNIDNNPKISFNDKYACFEIDFINKDGYEGSIFQDNEGIIAISSLINPNGEDVLDSFIEINNNSDIITDILILKDLNI